jgi:mono/diheme cytochrome c family protein
VRRRLFAFLAPTLACVAACSQDGSSPTGTNWAPSTPNVPSPGSMSESDGGSVATDPAALGAVEGGTPTTVLDAGPGTTLDAGPRPPAVVEAGQDSAQTDAQPSPPNNAITYQKHIRPLIVANCVECHTQGGIGPSDLSDWTLVKQLGGLIVNAVGEGRMPPWPASDTCHEIADSRALSADTKALFKQWQVDGFQEGNAADYVAPPARRRNDLGPANLVMKGAEAFTPGVNSDTYRCFSIGTVAADTYVTALDLIPGDRAEVHHIQLHRVEPEDAASIVAADSAAAGGGYPCNAGGAGIASQNLFSYRPGALAVVLNQGDAVYLKAGSGLLLQIHYNTQFLPRGSAPKPDLSSVAMWTLPAGQHPERVIYRTGATAPLNGNGSDPAARFASIPANATGVVGDATVSMGTLSRIGGTFLKGEIVGMTPHAHSWATRMVAQFKPATGAEQCLIDVPDWDFNWQLDYMYMTGVPYGQTDTVHIECNYDNSAANQPVLNGMRVPVMPLTWGEKTLDEMCLHYIWLRFAYADFAAAIGG